MKSILYWLVLSLLMVSQTVYAGGSGKGVPDDDDIESQQCDVMGQNYAEITFFVKGTSPNDSIFKENKVFTTNQGGNNVREVLWYTGDYNSDDSYIFHEPNLVVGEAYQIMLVNEGDKGGTRYYRRKADIDSETVDDDWPLSSGKETIYLPSEISSLFSSSVIEVYTDNSHKPTVVCLFTPIRRTFVISHIIFGIVDDPTLYIKVIFITCSGSEYSFKKKPPSRY